MALAKWRMGAAGLGGGLGGGVIGRGEGEAVDLWFKLQGLSWRMSSRTGRRFIADKFPRRYVNIGFTTHGRRVQLGGQSIGGVHRRRR